MTENEIEYCWCCDAAMTMKIVPFVSSQVWYCEICTPEFDYVGFIENYNF